MPFLPLIAAISAVRGHVNTHAEESDVVADKVTDDACFLWCLSLSLEKTGREDRRQFLAGHVVEMGTLLDPEKGKETTFPRWHHYLRT